MDINVVNKHHPNSSGEYIGRGSPLGNPFPLGNFLNRTQCVDAYKKYICDEITDHNDVIINELKRLHKLAKDTPLNLVCFCAPKECHGDIIKQILLGEI